MHRLNCAVLELQSTDDTVAGPAASELDRLTLRTNLQALSLRSLAAERLRRHDWSGARRYSDRLIQLPSCALEDQLMHLTVLQGVEFQAKQTGTTAQVSRSGVPVPDPPDEAPSTATSQSGVNPGSGFTDHLDRIQTHAGNNILEIYAVSEWMGAHGLAAQGLEWLERMDPKICKAQPIPLARANLYAALRDWAKLETFLHRAEWQEMEFLRQAFLARTAWGQNQEPSGDARWRCAVRSAGNRLGALMFLFKLGEEWSKDPEELLLAIWRGFPRERWAVAQLEQNYLATGNTRGLNQIYASRIDDIACASDITNRNDFACTSLLLGVDLPRAHALARQLYRERPDDVILASTYAYSLQVQGEIHEALAVFATFDEPTLETPAVALYYGLMLAKTGEAKRAQHFLRCAERVKLSPEESQLLHDAKRALP